MATRLAFFLPHFDSGGAEGVVLQVLSNLDRQQFVPELILQSRRGTLLERLPEDVAVTTLSPPRPPLCIRALARTVRSRRLSLLVTVNNAANLYALAAAALPGSHFATLVMEHTPPAAFLAEAKRPDLRRWLMRLLYPRASLAGGPLEEIGTDLADLLGVRAPPFRCLPNPVVDHEIVRRPVADVARHIVSVGRLAPEKRFDLLIDAFALVHAERPDTRLTLIGEGPERQALEARVAAAGLGDAVSLPGYRADIAAMHATSDLFVCTSRREGLGNAIIEAMAFGVPVVSVDCPLGPRHLLRGGTAGTLLEADDAPAIAAGVLALLADPARRRSQVEAARSVAEEYRVPAAVAQYADAFEAALATSKTADAVQ